LICAWKTKSSMVKTWFKSRASAFFAEQHEQKGHPFAIPADQHWAICLEVSACELKGLAKARAKRAIKIRDGLAI
jgi:hypothetical protein